MSDTLTELDGLIAALTDEEQKQLDDLVAEEASKPWLPDPRNTPQMDAYLSDADLLLYGGAAGGGKSDLLLGWSASEAERAVIFRRQSVDIRGLEERLIEIMGPGDYNRADKILRRPGKLIEFGHLEKPGSEQGWQGRPHDFIGFDEGAQLSAYKVAFVLGWLRSAGGRRCRAIIGSNPPVGGQGDWLIEWFAPWLDPNHPDPAEPGELRWAVMLGDADQIVTRWVDAAALETDEQGRRWTLIDGERYFALSRTFIPSKLDDNPYLRDTQYRAQINAMPEPLRSQLLHGDFLAGRGDHEWQVIPSLWITLAEERWRKREESGAKRPPMLHMGVDVAQGGGDRTVLARLHGGNHFAELVVKPGRDTPDGPSVARLILEHRKNQAGITLDLTGGWGGSARDHLLTHHKLRTLGFVASSKSRRRTKDRKWAFFNKRAEAWWIFREALNPESGEDIELPPDPKLRAELTAPHWKPQGDKILVESKEDIKKRIQASTDHADAVLMAWIDRTKTLARRAHEMTSNNRSQAVEAESPFADV